MDTRLDRTVLTIREIGDVGNDYAYWQNRSHEERLSTVEDIRRDYHAGRNDSEPGLQRVFRIIEQV